MSSASADPTGFVLRVPESWFEFDVWRATRTGDLARLVDTRITDMPELAPHRGALLKLLRQAAEYAERNGARFCAACTDVVDDAGTLIATAMVFHTEGAPDPAQNTVEAIAGQVTAVAPAAGSPTWRRVHIVEIPAGRAVRVSGVETADMGDGASLDSVTMQTLVPVPGGQGVLNLVLTSPQVQLAEPMLELFQAISDTLAWSGGGDRPPPPDAASQTPTTGQ
jgi:hypothetical protein